VTGLEVSEFEDRLTIHFDRGVATHLFSVAAGLKSVVPGEFEILGQLRRALELATDEQTVGNELNELFRRAITTGRRVRSETSIARGTTSFAQAAVSMALEELGDELDETEVVVLGAGQLATGVVRSLLDAPRRLGRLRILNRTTSRAQSLRDDTGDARVEVGSWDSLPGVLESARLVFVAVEVATPVLSRAHFEGVAGSVLVVDLGLPRAVSVDVEGIGHVHRVDISDLRQRVERALEGRTDAMQAAGQIVADDVEKFMDDQRERGAAAIVSELRDYFDDVVASEMTRREHELAALSEEQRELVRSLLRSVVAKIAHRPTVALKDAAGMDQGIRLTEATRNLFDL
jgi:glutamyl-tRNA reductase